MKFAIALILGLLTTSLSVASETLDLIDASSNRSEVIDVEETDQWSHVELDRLSELNEQSFADLPVITEDFDEEEVATLPIPEPAAAAILIAGLGSMGWMRYRLG